METGDLIDSVTCAWPCPPSSLLHALLNIFGLKQNIARRRCVAPLFGARGCAVSRALL